MSLDSRIAKLMNEGASDKEIAVDLIEDGEGFRKNPYICPAGYLTIGHGINLDSHKEIKDELNREGFVNSEGILEITESKSKEILMYFVDDIVEKIGSEKWYLNADTSLRKAVVIDMVYNLGLSGFKKFKKCLSAIEASNYGDAADEMMDSKWYAQVKNRGVRNVKYMRVGVIA